MSILPTPFWKGVWENTSLFVPIYGFIQKIGTIDNKIINEIKYTLQFDMKRNGATYFFSKLINVYSPNPLLEGGMGE